MEGQVKGDIKTTTNMEMCRDRKLPTFKVVVSK